MSEYLSVLGANVIIKVVPKAGVGQLFSAGFRVEATDVKFVVCSGSSVGPAAETHGPWNLQHAVVVPTFP